MISKKRMLYDWKTSLKNQLCCIRKLQIMVMLMQFGVCRKPIAMVTGWLLMKTKHLNYCSKQRKVDVMKLNAIWLLYICLIGME